MRNAIRHALTRMLNRLLPARGRHCAHPPRPPVQPAGPWAKPWPTAVPAHVVERHTPLRGEDLPAARPYAPRHRPSRALHYASHGLSITDLRTMRAGAVR
ncbi:hypothetical protein [Streptomyces sp. NBC_00690]|uniref:hypothetical protein n=1 Tax=Streptomyces sp. NBC_00690 TaxID=2975808 RepID=UPI002E2C6932|nr:hypothetical protein [Streptomyces sp. NBC_00690]